MWPTKNVDDNINSGDIQMMVLNLQILWGIVLTLKQFYLNMSKVRLPASLLNYKKYNTIAKKL